MRSVAIWSFSLVGVLENPTNASGRAVAKRLFVRDPWAIDAEARSTPWI